MDKEKINIEIGERIKEVRKSRGITLLELANKVGLSEGTVQRYETGQIVKVSISTLESFAGALGTTAPYLIGWDKSAPFKTYKEVPMGISAGLLEGTESCDDLPRISIPDAMLGKYAGRDNLVFVHVNGDSMNKVIENASLVGVLTNTTYNNGDIVVFSNGGEYAIKRYFNYPEERRVMFMPDSTDDRFPPIVLSYEEADEIKIWGKVVIYQVIL